MREIKFRAWDKRNHAIREVWNITWDFSPDKPKKIIALNPVISGEYILHEDNFILMQFTGLKDKNCKEIYEGDIIQLKWIGNTLDAVEYVGEIKWAKWCYHIFASHKKPSLVLDTINLNSRNPEVIGNIYQNPELLENLRH